MADGGYFDNFGIFTALEWLDEYVLPAKETLGINRVLIVEIRAFPQSGNGGQYHDQAGQNGKEGWEMALYGPFRTLLRVRDSTQIARNEKEVALMQERWHSKGGELEHVPVEFSEEDAYEAPLSWKLTEKEIAHINSGWDHLCRKSGARSNNFSEFGRAGIQRDNGGRCRQ